MDTTINKIFKRYSLISTVLIIIFSLLSAISFVVQMAIEEQCIVPEINHVYYTLNDFDEDAFNAKLDSLKNINEISSVECTKGITNQLSANRQRPYTRYKIDNQKIEIYDYSINVAYPKDVSFRITSDFGIVTCVSKQRLDLYNELFDGTCNVDKHIFMNIFRGLPIAFLGNFAMILLVHIVIIVLLWIYKKSNELFEKTT